MMGTFHTPFQTNLRCALWDLVDEGIDESLDRIQGQTGVTGIVLGLHTPPVGQIRPHPGVSPRTFRSAGGTQFQPDPACYAGTRIRPVVADWLRKRNPLKSVVEGCHQRGLKVGGWVNACEHPAVAHRYETAGTRDVFGDRSDRRLCPINPDVAEYLRGLVEDLQSNYAFDGLGLSQVGFASPEAPDLAAEECGWRWGPVEAWLRTICLCESCRQLAGRDGVAVESAVKRIANTLERTCQTGTCLELTPAEFVEKHEELGAFLEWRGAQMQRLLGSLRRACRCQLVLDADAAPMHSGLDLAEASSWYDVCSLPCRVTEAPHVEQAVAAGLALCGDPVRLGLRLGVGAGCSNSDALVASAVQAARMGCRAVEFDSYGILPLERLEWIRQACRFARREG